MAPSGEAKPAAGKPEKREWGIMWTLHGGEYNKLALAESSA
jgi:hypothetical protein